MTIQKLKLRRRQKKLWQEFCSLQKKDSFGGLRIASSLETLQLKMDRIGMKGVRFYPEITIDCGS